ncbi:hypothetical protein [Shewanella salipaludis]|uniref:Uncharacterized protein n=1 Tax=Shewanella salipaludis TaxID=2723052 RepID=A0A972JL43_9GAMM|nr:hypothetical protein [Shewanella salipaludis]NMH65799.1 hypothetical protein [Shewanella salipaludis]
MAKLFLLPLLLCLLWTLFLRINGVSLKQGSKGFGYILGISAIIWLMFAVLLWLTSGQNQANY